MAEGVGFGRWAAGVFQANFQHHVVFSPESKQSCHLQCSDDHERHFMDVTIYAVSFEPVLQVLLLSPLNSYNLDNLMLILLEAQASLRWFLL